MLLFVLLLCPLCLPLNMNMYMYMIITTNAISIIGNNGENSLARFESERVSLFKRGTFVKNYMKYLNNRIPLSKRIKHQASIIHHQSIIELSITFHAWYYSILYQINKYWTGIEEGDRHLCSIIVSVIQIAIWISQSMLYVDRDSCWFSVC